MKNMVAFAPYFSIFRHDEWGGNSSMKQQ